MDSRHQSLTQEISNELIHFLNKYIQENLDDVILDLDLCDEITKIAEFLYFSTDMQVDVERIIAKKNLLSIDTVFLPYIQESTFKSKKNAVDVSHFLKQIELITTLNLEENNSEFNNTILKIITRYHGILDMLDIK